MESISAKEQREMGEVISKHFYVAYKLIMETRDRLEKLEKEINNEK